MMTEQGNCTPADKKHVRLHITLKSNILSIILTDDLNDLNKFQTFAMSPLTLPFFKYVKAMTTLPPSVSK